MTEIPIKVVVRCAVHDYADLDLEVKYAVGPQESNSYSRATGKSYIAVQPCERCMENAAEAVRKQVADRLFKINEPENQ